MPENVLEPQQKLESVRRPSFSKCQELATSFSKRCWTHCLQPTSVSEKNGERNLEPGDLEAKIIINIGHGVAVDTANLLAYASRVREMRA